MKDIVFWLKQICHALKAAGQSNWTENDTTAASYIQNKPDIPSSLKAIALAGLPASGTNTVSLLNATGLTADEVKAASEGKRFGLVKDGVFYAIDGVTYTSATAYSITFRKAKYALDDDALVPAAGSVFYSATRSGTTVTCTAISIS